MCPRVIVVSFWLLAEAWLSDRRAAPTDIAASVRCSSGQRAIRPVDVELCERGEGLARSVARRSGACAPGDGGDGATGSPAFCGDALDCVLVVPVGASGLVHPASATPTSRQTGISPFILAVLIGPVGGERSRSPNPGRWGRPRHLGPGLPEFGPLS